VNYGNSGYYQVLSAEVGGKHGFSVSGLVFDEIHTQPNRQLYDVLTKGSSDAFNAMLNGIKNICGNIYGAVKGGFDKAIGFIKGLASQAFQWGADFIGGLAKGIEKSRGMIENAMNGVTSDLTITPRVMAAQGSYSGSAASSGDLISGINTALNTALAGGGAAGDIVIPVYIGGDMIDEIVVTAQQRMNLRSGGR